MPLRDIALVIALVGLVPLSFARPWIGVLAWSWIAYMAPHRLTWSFGATLPVALLIGGATLAGFLLTKDRQPLPRVWQVGLLAVFFVHITISTVIGFNPSLSFGKWDWVSKSMLIAVITTMLFQERTRLRWLYLTIALSLGFYGAKGGLWVLRTGGYERVWGPPGTFFGDNNTLGLALCMVLPIQLVLAREEPRRWLRWVLRITFALSIIATIFTYSRGAFLALIVITAITVWRSPWRWRFAAVVVATALVAAPMIPNRWWERIETIVDDEVDRSIQGRFQAWETSWNMAMASPLVGHGFRALWNAELWDRFSSGPYIAARDAHSLYFEVLGEHGFVGLGLYLALLLGTLVTLWRLRRRWRRHPEHGWIARYAEMTEMALYPFMVAGAFLGVAYFDLYFHLVMLTVVLKTLAAQVERAEASAPEGSRGRVSRLAGSAAANLGGRLVGHGRKVT